MIVSYSIILLKPEDTWDCCVHRYLSTKIRKEEKKHPQAFYYLSFVPHVEEYTRNHNHHPCILFCVDMTKKKAKPA